MSTSIVTITTVDEIVTVGNDGTAQHVFTIRNDTGAPVRVGIQTVVDAPVSKEWISVDKPERELGENDADQVSVTVKAPGDLAAGRYTYRIRVYSVKQPGEAFTEGESVAFEIAGKVEEKPEPVKEKKKCGWCIPVAIVVAVLVLGAGGYFVYENFNKGELIEVTDYSGWQLNKAITNIVKVGLTFSAVDLKSKWIDAKSVSKVVDQSPKPEELVKPDTPVSLTVGEDKRGYIFTPLQAKTMQKANPKVFLQIKHFQTRMIEPESE